MKARIIFSFGKNSVLTYWGLHGIVKGGEGRPAEVYEYGIKSIICITVIKEWEDMWGIEENFNSRYKYSFEIDNRI